MRGRLINKFIMRIAQLDTEATAADPDGAGPLTSGYDDVFRAPTLVPQAGEQLGESARQEKTVVSVPCQIEVEAFEMLQQFATGVSPRAQIKLVFHFRDLEMAGLVDQVNAVLILGTGASELAFTAIDPGVGGNSITVELADGASEAVEVTGTDIKVTLDTGVTTADGVKVLIEASGPASRLVGVASGGVGVVSVAAKQNFVGGRATGDALIRVNDRLVGIDDRRGNLVQEIRTPPGLYVTEAQPRGYGIGGSRNLLLVTFDDREVAVRGAA